jgi:hypothetical protein
MTFTNWWNLVWFPSAEPDYASGEACHTAEAAWDAALEQAALACEALLSGHPSSGPDAARRMCALKIRELKTVPSERDASNA